MQSSKSLVHNSSIDLLLPSYITVITGYRGSFSYLIDPGEVVAQVGLFQMSVVGAPSSISYWASLRLRLQRSGMDSKLFFIFFSLLHNWCIHTMHIPDFINEICGNIQIPPHYNPWKVY